MRWVALKLNFGCSFYKQITPQLVFMLFVLPFLRILLQILNQPVWLFSIQIESNVGCLLDSGFGLID